MNVSFSLGDTSSLVMGRLVLLAIWASVGAFLYSVNTTAFGAFVTLSVCLFAIAGVGSIGSGRVNALMILCAGATYLIGSSLVKNRRWVEADAKEYRWRELEASGGLGPLEWARRVMSDTNEQNENRRTGRNSVRNPRHRGALSLAELPDAHQRAILREAEVGDNVVRLRTGVDSEGHPLFVYANPEEWAATHRDVRADHVTRHKVVARKRHRRKQTPKKK